MVGAVGFAADNCAYATTCNILFVDVKLYGLVRV